jgi:hypothetical protein
LFHKHFIGIRFFSPEPEIAMNNSKCVSSPVKQLTHYHRIDSAADSQEHPFTGFTKFPRSYKSFEFLEHTAKIKNQDQIHDSITQGSAIRHQRPGNKDELQLPVLSINFTD